MMVLLGIRTYYVPDTDIARYASALSKPSDLKLLRAWDVGTSLRALIWIHAEKTQFCFWSRTYWFAVVCTVQKVSKMNSMDIGTYWCWFVSYAWCARYLFRHWAPCRDEVKQLLHMVLCQASVTEHMIFQASTSWSGKRAKTYIFIYT
jgi:hypothetical protein